MRNGEDVHAERFSDDRNSFAYLAHADDGYVLARELRKRLEPVAELLGSYPAAALNVFVVEPDPVGELEKKGDGHLCGCKGSVFRDVRNSDASSPAGFKVNYVVARGDHADVLEVRKLLQYLLRKGSLVRNYGLCSGSVFDYPVRRRDVVCGNVSKTLERLPAKVSGIGCRAVHDYYFHVITPLLKEKL